MSMASSKSNSSGDLEPEKKYQSGSFLDKLHTDSRNKSNANWKCKIYQNCDQDKHEKDTRELIKINKKMTIINTKIDELWIR